MPDAAAAPSPPRLLGLCGSLRAASRSRVLLQATGLQAAARGHRWTLFEGLGALPLFNPDDEADPPPAVRALRDAVTAADAIVVASPEYAHGVTGTIKNALDWLVGHVPFSGKPVAVFNPSHRATHADAALQETLRTMDARLVPGACRRLPATASADDAATLAAGADCGPGIAAALEAIDHHLAAVPLPEDPR